MRRPAVFGPQIAGVPRIAAPHGPACMLENHNAGTGFARRDRRAQGGIAATNDQHIRGFRKPHPVSTAR